MRRSRLLATMLILIMIVQPFGGIAAYANNDEVIDIGETQPVTGGALPGGQVLGGENGATPSDPVLGG